MREGGGEGGRRGIGGKDDRLLREGGRGGGVGGKDDSLREGERRGRWCACLQCHGCPCPSLSLLFR